MSKKNEVVAAAGAAVPDYIKKGTNRGSEGVGMDDLIIPRLEIVQSLSPARKKSDPGYIPGAEEGMMFNSVTRELYTDAVAICPVIFKKEWLIWRDRKDGGGFRGSFDSAAAAAARLEDINATEQGNFEALDTHQHFVLLVKPDGTVEELALSMSRSKMKVSRQFNSIIRINGGDRFGRVYSVEAVEDTNDRNESYYNFKITNSGFPSEPVYRRAEKLYNDIASGVVKAKVDTNFEEEAASGSEDEAF